MQSFTTGLDHRSAGLDHAESCRRQTTPQEDQPPPWARRPHHKHLGGLRKLADGIARASFVRCVVARHGVADAASAGTAEIPLEVESVCGIYASTGSGCCPCALVRPVRLLTSRLRR